RRALWRSVGCRSDERLDFDQYRSRALHRPNDGRPADVVAAFGEEDFARIAHFPESILAHLEHSDLIRGAKPILDTANDSVGMVAIPLEVQHRVDHVLENTRTRDRALLRDMSDQERRKIHLLRELVQRSGSSSHLSHRTLSSLYFVPLDSFY